MTIRLNEPEQNQKRDQSQNKKRLEKGLVYVCGLAQGVALVAYPAAGNLFTSAEGYHLSHGVYGALFLPQTLFSVVFSLLMARLAGAVSLRTLLLFGLSSNLSSMGLFALSALFMHVKAAALPLLFCGTSLLGAGFGITVPTLNTLSAQLFAPSVDKAILLLNALLGLGTALAPLLIAFFSFIGLWWGLPLSTFALFALLLALTMRTSAFSTPALQPSDEHGRAMKKPPVFWLFALFALLYGVVETVNGNWSVIAMKQLFNATANDASFALMAFWGSVTLGRLSVASVGSKSWQERAFWGLPLVVGLAFFLMSVVSESPYVGIALFAMAGFGCSALLPLTISFALKGLPQLHQSIAGSMVGLYLCGYGLAAFGVGFLNETLGWSLANLFLASAFLAVTLSLLAFYLSKTMSTENRKPSQYV